ncbi:hypothetical protein F5879DRAFT_921716 [Lentinula edodes]|nr:hypothetical protein F5879DRAFT_921716 [Lentinula edodes]
MSDDETVNNTVLFPTSGDIDGGIPNIDQHQFLDNNTLDEFTQEPLFPTLNFRYNQRRAITPQSLYFSANNNHSNESFQQQLQAVEYGLFTNSTDATSRLPRLNSLDNKHSSSKGKGRAHIDDIYSPFNNALKTDLECPICRELLKHHIVLIHKLSIHVGILSVRHVRGTTCAVCRTKVNVLQPYFPNITVKNLVETFVQLCQNEETEIGHNLHNFIEKIADKEQHLTSVY